MTNLNNLTDADLDLVCGGMDCQTAVAVADLYLNIAGILGAVGNAVQSANFSGKAAGVIQGACGK